MIGTGISGMLSDATAVSCQRKNKAQQKAKKKVTHIYLTSLLLMLQYVNLKMFSWYGLHIKKCDIGCDNLDVIGCDATHFVILLHVWDNRYSISKYLFLLGQHCIFSCFQRTCLTSMKKKKLSVM